MLLAHHPDALERLRTPTVDAPLRVLVSGCLAGWRCGVDESDNGVGGVLRDLLALPHVAPIGFCPEQHTMGTPRTTPDLHGGDGFDVLAGSAQVRDEHGVDLTEAMIAGARAMLQEASTHQVELALLTDMSAACGSQVISLGCRFDAERRYQKGVGVATAMLLQAGIPVLSQRDFHSLAKLRRKLDPAFPVDDALRDHHEHEWTRANLPGEHPRV